VINCGIIGYGKIGQIRVQTLEDSALANVSLIYDSDLSANTKYRCTQNEQEIINNPDIDAVFIATPNLFNKPLTIAALRNGKHVFCEKPPAFTGKDVKEIQAIERKSGKKLMYGFNHRHHGSILKAQEVVKSRDYGEILWMRGRYGKSVDESFFDNWRSKKKLAGGGILLDQGIHMLDIMLLFAGNFDEVQAMVSNVYWKLDGIEDNVFANFKNTKTGVVASIHSTMTQWRHLFSLEIFLEKGHIVLNGLKTQSGTYGNEHLVISRNKSCTPTVQWENDIEYTYKIDHSMKNEVSLFLESIINDRKIVDGSSDDAYKVMSLIDKIYNSNK